MMPPPCPPSLRLRRAFPWWLLVLALVACAAPAATPTTPGSSPDSMGASITQTLPLVLVTRDATASPTPPPAPRPPKRVLLVTATEGYYHDAIPTARTIIQQLASETGEFVVETIPTSNELGRISAETLRSYDLLFFANTSGELPLSDEQKQAILDFVAGGKGFIGTHSASDTLYQWEAYGQMLGGYFLAHPWTQGATVTIEGSDHPANAGLGGSYSLLEEFYTFRTNPRPTVHVLQSLDAASVGASGDFPLVWCRPHGAGRVYYNALGHFDSTWQDARFQSQLLGAMRWASGLVVAPCELPGP